MDGNYTTSTAAAAALVTPVPLPGGRTWWRRETPDPARFQWWTATLQQVAESPDSLSAWARERMALLAAYDGGWDVTDERGAPLRAPRELSLPGWNAVPREVIEAMLDHLDGQAREGLDQAEVQPGVIV